MDNREEWGLLDKVRRLFFLGKLKLKSGSCGEKMTICTQTELLKMKTTILLLSLSFSPSPPVPHRGQSATVESSLRSIHIAAAVVEVLFFIKISQGNKESKTSHPLDTLKRNSQVWLSKGEGERKNDGKEPGQQRYRQTWRSFFFLLLLITVASP